MAERGGQIGNDNATKNRPFAEAIRRAIAQEDGKKLRDIADKLITMAAAGDISALKEFADRVDGKSLQAIVGADGEAFVHEVRITLVKPE